MNVRGLRGALIRISAVAAVITAAHAAWAAPVVTVSIDTVGIYDNYTVTQETTPNPDGTFGLGGVGYGTDFTCDWSVAVNPDPSITGTFNLTNLSASTQSFVLSVTLPTAAIAGPTATGGYLGDVTYSDANNDSIVSYDPVSGNPLYLSLIDGLAFQGINVVSGPAFGGPGISTTSSRASFGLPGLTQPGPSVASNIGIRMQFSLTAGDHVVLPVFFQVESAFVPEPSVVLLLGAGLAGLALARKRRE